MEPTLMSRSRRFQSCPPASAERTEWHKIRIIYEHLENRGFVKLSERNAFTLLPRLQAPERTADIWQCWE